MGIQVNLIDEDGSPWRYAKIKDVRACDEGRYADVDVALYYDVDARRVDIAHDVLPVRLTEAEMGGMSPSMPEIYAALKRACPLLDGPDIL